MNLTQHRLHLVHLDLDVFTIDKLADLLELHCYPSIVSDGIDEVLADENIYFTHIG